MHDGLQQIFYSTVKPVLITYCSSVTLSLRDYFSFFSDAFWRQMAHYPITSVVISEKRGRSELHDFPTPNDLHSLGSWDKSKNPYPLGNCIIPNSATAGAQGTTQPATSWLLDASGCLIGNYTISQWVWVIAIIMDTSLQFPLHVGHHKHDLHPRKGREQTSMKLMYGALIAHYLNCLFCFF